MRFVRVLSREIPFVNTRDPVYGMPSISSKAGTCASRASPPRPSAILKQISGFVSRRANGRSRSAWIKTVVWPSISSAARSKSTVSIWSKSAKASGGTPSGLGWWSSLILARTAIFQYRFIGCFGVFSSARLMGSGISSPLDEGTAFHLCNHSLSERGLQDFLR